MAAAFLASCGMGQTTPSDFASLYNANIKAEMQKAGDFIAASYGEKKEISGQVNGVIEAGTTGDEAVKNSINASFQSDYVGVAGGSAFSEISLVSPKLEAEVTENGATTKIQGGAKSIDFFSGIIGFFRLNDIILNVENSADPVVAEEAKKLVEKLAEFSGKWVAVDQNEDLPESTKKFLEKIFSLTTADIEKFLIENHFFVASGEPKVDGTKYTYNVNVDKEKILALVVDFVKNATAQEVTAEQKEEIKAEFDKITIAGTMTFDTKNPLYNDTNIVISREGEKMSAKLNTSRIGEEMKFSIALLDTDKELGKFDMLSIEKGDVIDFRGALTMSSTGDEPTELAKYSGKIEKAKLKNFDLDVNALVTTAKVVYVSGEKLTAVANSMGKNIFNLEHTIAGDKHAGKASVQDQEVANWTFDTAKSMLNALSFTVKNIDSVYSDAENLVEVNLAKADGNDMATGKIKTFLGGAEFTGDLSLRIEKEKFGFMLHNFSGKAEDTLIPMEVKKLEIFSSYKEKTSNKNLVAPTEFVKISEFEKALGIERSPVIDYNYDNADLSLDAIDESEEISLDEVVAE